MTQVSRLSLPKALEEQMHTLLRRALADLHTESDIGDFLEDLLTPTEKTMLAKRFAIAVLLDKGYDQRTIHRIMSVSVATVNSVNYWLKNKGKGYRKVIEKIRREAQWREFLDTLDSVLERFFSLPRTSDPARSMKSKEFQPRDTIV